jgi:hypothetical protein
MNESNRKVGLLRKYDSEGPAARRWYEVISND